MFKPELNTLEACHRLALTEGQKENRKEVRKQVELLLFLFYVAITFLLALLLLKLHTIHKDFAFAIHRLETRLKCIEEEKEQKEG